MILSTGFNGSVQTYSNICVHQSEIPVQLDNYITPPNLVMLPVLHNNINVFILCPGSIVKTMKKMVILKIQALR